VIDAATAEGEHFAVGDRIRIGGEPGIRAFTVSGIATFGGVDSFGGATVALFDVPAARAMVGKTGFDLISVSARPGVSDAALMAQIAPLLPANAGVATGEEQAAADSAEIGEVVDFLRYFLLAFGGVALLVGAFVIFNTLSITVAQRTRELATLRTLGATRRRCSARSSSRPSRSAWPRRSPAWGSASRWRAA
jgi:putative ABC transport system permease protein